MIKNGESSIVNYLYYSRWKDKVQKEEHKNDMAKSAEIALQNGNIYSYIFGYAEISREINKNAVLLSAQKNNYKFFGKEIGFNNIINQVFDFYNRLLNEKIPVSLLKKIEKESKKIHPFNSSYFWVCRQLNKKPETEIVQNYYDFSFSSFDLEGMKKAKDMLSEKLSKTVLLERAKTSLKKGDLHKAKIFFTEYYS